MRQPPVVLIRENFVPVLTWISFYEGKDFCQFSPSRGHATHNPYFPGSYKRDLATKDAVFGNCHLLKKVDENFIL